jgi:hypothetical protein
MQPALRAVKVGWFLALGVILISAGCGSSGPPRYPISGKVTYGGQPVVAGSVMLVPDTRQGNQGPAVSVAIKDGQYDSNWEGIGHVGGPHVVKITGLDGKTSPEFPRGMLLFPEFELILDLPNKAEVKDLEVPADWVMPRTGPVTNHGA